LASAGQQQLRVWQLHVWQEILPTFSILCTLRSIFIYLLDIFFTAVLIFAQVLYRILYLLFLTLPCRSWTAAEQQLCRGAAHQLGISCPVGLQLFLFSAILEQSLSLHSKPGPFDKQFCMANIAFLTSYTTFQSFNQEIFYSRQM
jgi:hypothetical protein